jgi:predicted enzyme related to lactoylglutathione lyase
MGMPVVHVEVIGKDGDALRRYYSELFGWRFDVDNPMAYGVFSAEENRAPDGTGIGGGVAAGPEGYEGHVTFYVGVPDVEAALAKAEQLGGTRLFGPDEVMPGMVLGQFRDPEGHLIGLVSGSSRASDTGAAGSAG